MFDNVIPQTAQTRQPRGIVTINGTQATFIEAEVDSTTYFLADTFSVTLPIDGQPAQLNEQYFASTDAMMVQIYMGFPDNPASYTTTHLKSFIMGQVDRIDIDYLNRTYTLSGRDLTAKFIDNKTTNKYPNLTASQIVQKLAAKEGLTAVVIPTTTPAGVLYANNNASISKELPEWDLITFLAQNENYIAYVENTTVYFVPQPKSTDPSYLMQFQQPTSTAGYTQFSGKSLSLVRNLTVSRDVIVKVRSWHNGLKKSITATVHATPNKGVFLASQAQPIGDAQTYTYSIPGLTKEQAIQRAQQIARNISIHERKFVAEFPGDTILDKIGIMKLAGLNTAFDQVYFTSSIKRTLSPNGGFTMTVDGKNHSPNSQVAF